MLDMNFWEFLVLLVVSLVTTFIVHYGFRYRSLQGADGFFWKLVASWIFAWLGSPVLGHWFMWLRIQNIYLIPALLGGFVGAFCSTAILKAIATPQKTTT